MDSLSPALNPSDNLSGSNQAHMPSKSPSSLSNMPKTSTLHKELDSKRPKAALKSRDRIIEPKLNKKIRDLETQRKISEKEREIQKEAEESGESEGKLEKDTTPLAFELELANRNNIELQKLNDAQNLEKIFTQNLYSHLQDGKELTEQKLGRILEKNIKLDKRILAQTKALMDQDFESYLDMDTYKGNRGMNPLDSEEHIDEFLDLDKDPFATENVIKRRRAKSNDSRKQRLSEESSISTDRSMEESMLREYWDDFDEKDNLKKSKEGTNFIDLDSPFVATSQKEKQEFQKLKGVGADRKVHEKPQDVLLTHYDTLSQKYKMPSINLLKLQKEEYRAYIAKLRDVAKVLVRRAKKECRIKCKKYLHEKFDQYKESIELESSSMTKQFIKIKEELEERQKEVDQFHRKFIDQEIMIDHMAILLSNAGIDYFELTSQEERRQLQREIEKENRDKLLSLSPQKLECECEKKYYGLDYCISLSKPFSLYSFQAPLLNMHSLIPDAEERAYLREENEIYKRKIEVYEKGFKTYTSLIDDKKQAAIIEEQRKIEVKKLNQEIEDLKDKHEQEIARLTSDHKAELEALSSQYYEYKITADEETKINEAIRFAQRKEINKLKTDIRKLNKIMLVPRLHSKYIEKVLTPDDLPRPSTPSRPKIKQYELPLVSQMQTISSKLAAKRSHLLSRNVQTQMRSYNSVVSMKKPLSSHTRLAMLTSRETIQSTKESNTARTVLRLGNKFR
ncbi:unnamed protein product [Moneuplotes crassus]|uniref:Uncharacterized protein n=1 Tax=Euplotes crassus TaxID=5936 RepID=A0AAD1XQS4_EUPCR|nr:unnamed protein product [Moneuplotes crassus]